MDNGFSKPWGKQIFLELPGGQGKGRSMLCSIAFIVK